MTNQKWWYLIQRSQWLMHHKEQLKPQKNRIWFQCKEVQFQVSHLPKIPRFSVKMAITDVREFQHLLMRNRLCLRKLTNNTLFLNQCKVCHYLKLESKLESQLLRKSTWPYSKRNKRKKMKNFQLFSKNWTFQKQASWLTN